RVNQDDTLLEIGSGYGRLTIPLAKVAKGVTVVEPSRRMVAILRRNALAQGIKNLRFINKRWEDVKIGKDIMKHDIVLASFSLLLLDLKGALQKIDLATKKVAYIFLSAESWIPEDIQKLVFGEGFKILSDHIIVYNLLHSLGIEANVEIMDYEAKRRFTTVEEAVKEFAEVYMIPDSKIGLLKDHLRSSLIKDADGLWHIRRKKVAMIWWSR
ncbi:MAG: methyltransferase domain-containing protein, partial [Nitrososphaerales archaeon]|nr:methyltransferase domain-containing protein [Nitrososphaerales archaeon]